MTDKNKNIKIKKSDKKADKKPPVTTGHSWDNIEEYNTPAPRWWLIVWFVSIIWAVVYWVFFPSWPSPKGNLEGTLKWTSRTHLEAQQEEIKVKHTVYLEEFRKSSFDEILKNPKLLQFALDGGKAAFQVNCAQCHGTGATGAKGFPNLNDDDWLWGGKLEDIYTTLSYGIRSGHESARDSQMPAFGKDEILNKDQIDDVIQHVRSLSKLDKPNADGAKIFAENCAVCHGEKGIGDRSIGAPNLSDSIWLYGPDAEDISYAIYNSRKGVMPNWNQRLNEDTIRQLTLYVHSLGGGE